MADMIPKVAEIHGMLSAIGSRALIEVDGGIDAKTAPEIVKAGASVLVAGTAVFRAKDGAESAIANLHHCTHLLPPR